MAKTQTEKSRYPSRYSDSYITGRQYIIELICEKKARFERTDLPRKFWQLDEWSSFYKMWLRRVGKLLTEYDERAIIRALQSKESGLKWSLHSEYMVNLIEKYQKEIDTEKEKVMRAQPDNIDRSKKEYRQRKNKVDKMLEGLD